MHHTSYMAIRVNVFLMLVFFPNPLAVIENIICEEKWVHFTHLGSKSQYYLKICGHNQNPVVVMKQAIFFWLNHKSFQTWSIVVTSVFFLNNH